MNHLHHCLLTLVLSLISLPTLALEHWFIPTEAEIKTIVIHNPTDSAQIVWISRPIDGVTQGFNETSYQVNAQQNLELPLSGDTPEANWRTVNFMHVKAQSKLLTAEIVDSSGTLTEWPKGNAASFQDFAFFARTVVITNLTPFDQTLLVNGESITLPGFGKIRKDISAGNFEAQGSARFMVTSVSSEIRALRFDPSAVPLPAPADGHFFLLTNGAKNQSYVVNLTDPQMIAQAQDQIKNPIAPGGRILMAQVGKNSGGFNRDLNDSKKTPWSWHVERALHFAELGAQDCDGSPEMVEESAALYANNSGIICFWSYRIVKELTPSDVSN